uniref:Uncharacterized protein n=1 Tax=Anguilla anguilla TaxID=7936 RepID=A0A0E9W527_ANGAN
MQTFVFRQKKRNCKCLSSLNQSILQLLLHTCGAQCNISAVNRCHGWWGWGW